MKHHLISIYTVLAAIIIGSAAAFAGENLLRLSDIKVNRVGENLVVALDISPRAVNPGRDKEVIFTPVVTSADGKESVSLPSVRIAGRNRYYSHIRNKDLAQGEKVYDASSKETIQYRAEVPFEEWMKQSKVDVRQSLANCCKAAVLGEDKEIARLDYEVPVLNMEEAYRFVELTGDSAVELTAEGRAYIDFMVNRTEIKPKYRRNRIELAKIIESVDKVKNDPDATITRIAIKGYASPEGPYSNNVRLAMGRTASLKDYVRDHYNFDPEIMHTDYEAEDWGGLRDWVEKSTITHRKGILDIIDSKMEPDAKNSEIESRYPEEYKLLLDSVYPSLRHSDYTIKYRIRAYATVEELLEVYKKTPERMRPVDFQRIASVYPSGSEEYEAIMIKAVEIHPNDPQSNINAATIALRRGDIAAADRYLAHAGNSAEAAYTRATAAALQKDYDRAARLFEEAAALGLPAAQAELERVREIQSRPAVEYLVPTAE